MSDAQYDLTLALLNDLELANWRAQLVRSMGAAREAGEDVTQLERRLSDVAVERERRSMGGA